MDELEWEHFVRFTTSLTSDLMISFTFLWAGLNGGLFSETINGGLFSETMDFRDFPSVLSAVRIAQS